MHMYVTKQGMCCSVRLFVQVLYFLLFVCMDRDLDRLKESKGGALLVHGPRLHKEQIWGSVERGGGCYR